MWKYFETQNIDLTLWDVPAFMVNRGVPVFDLDIAGSLQLAYGRFDVFSIKPSPLLFMAGDDYAGNSSTSGVILLDGASVSGHISGDTDVDWLAMRNTNGPATIELVLTSDSVIGVEVNVIGLDLGGNVVHSAHIATDINGTFIFSVPSFNTVVDFFLELIPTEDFAHDYTVELNSASADLAGDASTTGVLGVDGLRIPSTIQDQSDIDWFAIQTLEDETLYEFVLTSDAFGSGLDVNLISVDASNSILQREDLLQSPNGTVQFTRPDVAGATNFFIEIAATQAGTTDYVAEINTVILESTEEDVTGDLSADTSTEGLLYVGSQAVGEKSSDGDLDWYAFTATAGQSVTFSVNFDNPYLNQLTLFDENGVQLAQGTADTLTSFLNYSFTASGTYYVQVDTAVDNEPYDGGLANRYYLNAVKSEADDYTADINTDGILPVDGSVTTGEFEFAGDSDWFRFSLTEASEIGLGRFSSTEAGGPLDYEVTFAIYDTSGNLLAESQRINNINRLDYIVGSAGEYFLAVNSLASGPRAGYEVSLDITPQSEGGDEYSANIYTNGSLVVGGADATGVMQSEGDEDWFAFEATAGQTITFFAQSDANGAARPDLETRPRLSIYDADGNEYSFSSFSTGENISNGSISATFFAAETGTYYLGFSGSMFSDGAYTISSQVIVDEAGATVDTAADLSLDNSPLDAGLQYSSDDDWFRFSVQDNEALTITLSGADNNGLRGLNINFNDASGENATGISGLTPTFNAEDNNFTLTYFFEMGGIYFLTIQDFGGQTTDYTLQAEITPDDFGQTINSAGVMPSIGEISGTINYEDDKDWIRINIDELQEVFFELLVENSSFVGPVMKIYDAGGNLIFDDPRGTSESYYALIDFQVTGTFYLEVSSQGSAFFGDDVIGDYTLSTSIVANGELYGTPSGDSLTGTSGQDRLSGLIGDDTLNAGAGDDILNGGEGDDLMSGGSGRDIFIFRSGDNEDQITDFNVNEDRLQLEGWDPYTMLSDVREMFSDHAGYMLINFGNGDMLRLDNVSSDEINLENFIFSSDHEDGIGPFLGGRVFVDGGVDKGAAGAQEKPDVVPVSEPYDDAAFIFKAPESADIIADVLDEGEVSDVTGEFVATQEQLEAFALGQIRSTFESDPLYSLNEWGILTIFTPDDDGYWGHIV